MKIFQIDAFARKHFEGNPASICPLEEWISSTEMQKIAEENNQAETCFFVPKGDQFEIRWFTPAVEVDLCGHATLAAAHVLFQHYSYQKQVIVFNSPRSGELKVRKEDKNLVLNFPADSYKEVELNDSLLRCFDRKPVSACKGKTDYMLIFQNEDDILSVKPDLAMIAKLPARGIIITARGKEVDFVSRFFAPQSGINEDPVTGSAHTTLVPYWHAQTGKKEFNAIQLSSRRGYLTCTWLGDRVEISGQACTYMVGDIMHDRTLFK